MKTTYVLLVGINDYPAPISRLFGCLKDLERIETYLHAYVGQGGTFSELAGSLPVRACGPLRLCRLENGQATYANVIRGFRDFLRQAGPGDVAWFHFSGHGSEEFTAEEFLALEPNGKDQTLVCYRAGEDDGRLHLADKELAVLLHEVATQDAQGQPKGGDAPHLVVSLDCCHSGSGTRDFAEEPQLRTRAFKLHKTARPAAADRRPLDSYAGGYYAGQWQEQRRLDVPLARHVLLSACESVQKAGDLPDGGIFTSGLIQALASAQGKLNYADLFVRTRSTTRRLRGEQTPQFETLGNFDPFTRFLDGSVLGTPDRYEVLREGDNWLVKCGAIHGLPVVSQAPVALEIQTAAPENKPVARAVIQAVGAQRSKFDLVEGGPLDREGDYQAVIRYLPARPAFVWLHGEQEGLQRLKDRWDPSKNIQWLEDPAMADEAPLEVEVAAGHYRLRDRRSGKLVWQRPADGGHAPLIVESLGKIVKWDRTRQLDNPKSKIRQWVDFELGIRDKSQQETNYRAGEIRLYVNPGNFLFHAQSQALYSWFFPKVTIRGARQELYCYLLHLRADYSIEAPEGEVVFRPGEHAGKAEVELPLLKSPRGWGLSPDEPESTSYFQLLVTTEPLDYQQLLQSGLGEHRATLGAWKPFAVKDDWCSCVIKVTLVRAEAQLPAGAAFAAGRLRINPQAELRAQAAFSSAPRDEKSADPAAQFPRFQSPNLRLLDLRSGEQTTRQEVLELRGLEPAQPNNPLEVVIAETLDPGEILLPIAFDGRDFRLIGDAESQGDRTLVRLRELPDVRKALPAGAEIVPNPLDADDAQHRSLYEILKIGFFKLDLTAVNLRQLTWVDFSGGLAALRKDGIAKRWAAAGKVALLLPALLAEPADMAAYWRNVLDREKDRLLTDFDLVLVCDILHPPSAGAMEGGSSFPVGRENVSVFALRQNGGEWRF